MKKQKIMSAATISAALWLVGAPIAQGLPGLAQHETSGVRRSTGKPVERDSRPDTAPAIKILSETTLPPELAKAVDVRWAGDRSVYLALRTQGVVEYALGAPSATARVVVPGREQPGGFWFATLLGVSGRKLVAASPAMSFTAVDLETKIRREDSFDAIHALDLYEDRLLILGMRRDEQQNVGSDGAIAWLGPVGRSVDDLKPVAYDATGPGIRNMMLCGGIRMGGVRFLADGRFVVVPGVQPGAQLYDRDGRLTRAWDTAALADSDCGALSPEASRALAFSIQGREDWINLRRTIDTVVPLPEGPGLIVRSLEAGRLRWDLWILPEIGEPKKYRLPVDVDGENFHLRGDFRAGRMIFILSEERAKDQNYPAPRIFIALPPA